MNWMAKELDVTGEQVQIYMEHVMALSRNIQPCDVCGRLRDAATILGDPEGVHRVSLTRVVNEFISTSAPPSEEELTEIASVLAHHKDDGSYYAFAGDWVNALTEYITILNSQMGIATEESVAIANKYVEPLTQEGDENLTAYIEILLEDMGG